MFNIKTKNYNMEELTHYTYLVCDSIIILGEQMMTEDLNSGVLNIDFQLISNIWTILSLRYTESMYKINKRNGLLSLNIFKKHKSDIYDEILNFNKQLAENEMELMDSMRLLRNKFTHSPNSIQSYGWESVISGDKRLRVSKNYDIFNGLEHVRTVKIEYDKVKLVLIRLIKILNTLGRFYKQHWCDVVHKLDKGILQHKVNQANKVISENWKLENKAENTGIPL